MGISLSTARIIAPASFIIDFAAQLYGMQSNPSMLDVHKEHFSFFSPQPFFIAGFFSVQQLAQLAWLWRLMRTLDESKPEHRRELEDMVDFVPFYAVGNLCIASWMLFWNSSQLEVSNGFVAINTLAQLYYVARRLPPMDLSSWGSILTHVVSKTFAGIGVLDLLHNTSAAFFVGDRAPAVVQALTGIGFAGASAFSDWIFGGCLLYDLLALTVGQKDYDASWSGILGGYAAVSAAIVGLKNWFRPPYGKQSPSYSRVEER